MAIPRIPIFGDDKPTICAASGMELFLEEPGGEFMRHRIGPEVRVARRAVENPKTAWQLDVTRGETFRSTSNGEVTGGRYLLRDPRVGGRIIGALNFNEARKSHARHQVIVSNIVVDKSFRRQGVATQLLRALLQDHPGARVDSSMTSDGAAFFGHSTDCAVQPSAQVSAASTKRPRARA